ncbi:MAG: hypothetical protein M0P19_11060 [Nevskia sp.]|nr:hypothetical protein [Nevskia sp.]MCK9384798.1 hypothetical protein [Nevskia sp.]
MKVISLDSQRREAYVRLRNLGEKNVRVALQIGTLGGATEDAFAREWLAKIDRGRNWHNEWLGKIALVVVGTLITAGILHFLGWR